MLRLALVCLTLASAAQAQDRAALGTGRLFTNDFIGDHQDRWQSGNYVFSHVRGPGWLGQRPAQFGAILEYRLRADIIASSVEGPGGAVDRPYAGALSFGLHTHSSLGPLDLSVGADAMIVGPQTGISTFQEWYHDLTSLPGPLGTDSQLGNAFHAGLTAELSYPLRLSDRVTLRPFAELQMGIEDIARLGADIVVGAVGHGDLLLRDRATGTLYRGIEGPETGLALIAGADWAQVSGSVFLPADQGYQTTDTRWRARAGVHWQLAPNTSFFYGVTYLSEEFVGQPEGQLVGSLKLNFNY